MFVDTFDPHFFWQVRTGETARSVVGIPFGIHHLELAGIALAPIGKPIVTKEVVEAARKARGETTFMSDSKMANVTDGGTK